MGLFLIFLGAELQYGLLWNFTLGNDYPVIKVCFIVDKQTFSSGYSFTFIGAVLVQNVHSGNHS